MKLQDGEFRDLISNIMEPTHPFLLPRTVPTSAAVMYHKPQIAIEKDLSLEPQGYVIIRPSIDRTVTLCNLAPAGSVQTEAASYGNVINPVESRYAYFLSGDLRTDTHDVPYGVERNDTNRHISVERAMEPGSYHWKGLSWAANAKFDFVVYTHSPQFTGTVSIQRRNVGSTVWTTIMPGLAVTADVQGTINGSFTIAAAQSNQDFRCYLGSTAEGVAIQRCFVRAYDGFTYAGGYVRQELSLWELLGNTNGADVSKRQFEQAEKYSFTGFSALLRNTTAAQYKSGSVVSAQYPGGSESLIPQEPNQTYKFVSSYNDPKSYSGQLNKGVHWFFTPEKVQDWYFQPTKSEGDRPYVVIAWSGVAVNDMANMLGLTLDIKANIELLTTDISLMKFMPTADLSRLMELYITIVNSHNSVGENPSHMKRIAKIVADVVKNPHVRQSLGLMLEAGKVVLPLVLAAL